MLPQNGRTGMWKSKYDDLLFEDGATNSGETGYRNNKTSLDIQ